MCKNRPSKAFGLSTHVKDFAQFAAALYQRMLERLKVSVVLTETS